MVGEGFERVGVRHVDDPPLDPPVLGELGHRPVEHGLLDVGDHQLRALVEQRPAQSLADAAGAPGDDRDLVGEVREVVHSGDVRGRRRLATLFASR